MSEGHKQDHGGASQRKYLVKKNCIINHIKYNMPRVINKDFPFQRIKKRHKNLKNIFPLNSGPGGVGSDPTLDKMPNSDFNVKKKIGSGSDPREKTGSGSNYRKQLRTGSDHNFFFHYKS